MQDFKKDYIISATPEELYAALTFKPTIELWTGSPAVFEHKENTEFSLWDDSIVGKNLKFEDGRLIEQEWFFGDQEKPSIVTIKLHVHKKGCSMEVNHTNIPEDAFDEISSGWNNVYAAALIDFYDE